MSFAAFLRRLFNPSIVVQRKRAVMIDVETLSLEPNAAIYMIGAVKFNLGERAADPRIMEMVASWENGFGTSHNSCVLSMPQSFFYGIIDPSQFLDAGNHHASGKFDVSEATLVWTQAKNKDLYDRAVAQGGSIEHVLTMFNTWLADTNPQITCSNSPTFDHQIIDNAFTESNVVETPHKSLYFRNQFDVRTIGHMRDAINMRRYPQLPDNLKLHHPIHDCINQIESIVGFTEAVERGYL